MRTVLLIAVCLFLIGRVAAAEPTWWQDVRPVLKKHCTACHSARTVADPGTSGGLALDTYAAALRGKRPAVRPGDRAGSPLLERILAQDEERRMPAGGKALAPDTIALLERWIDAGALEGKPPEARREAVARRTPRRIDVTIATPVTPPAEAFPGVPPAPLALALRVGPVPPATTLAFSPDGTLLACGGQGIVTLWDLRLGQVARSLTGLGAVNAVRFHPDGAIVAVGGGEPGLKGDIRLFGARDGKAAGVLTGHADVVTALAFAPDGKTLASASHDHTVRFWNLEPRKCSGAWSSHADAVHAIAYSPDGRRVATAGHDRTARVFDLAAGKQTFSLGVLEELNGVAFGPGGKLVVAAGAETTLYWWDAATGERVRQRGAHHAAVTDLAADAQGKVLASGSADKTVRFWDTVNGGEKQALILPSHVYAVAVSSDGKLAAAACCDGRVRLYDVGTLKHLLTLLAVPGDDGETYWLAQTGQGYLIGSPKLLITGRWSMGGKAVKADPVWKVLFNPQAVSRAARGEGSAPPSFAP